ncbi:MAG: NADH-quinone oxidoreductase subunit NuoK [Sulfurospirillum sp.]|nr:NADH-quinone oxidoreductase subunit NuoK [Sulfurospirillum sp.]
MHERKIKLANSILAYVTLAMILFSTGLVGVIVRKNIFIIYMSIELLLNAIILLFVALARYYESMDAQVIALFVIAVAAAEAAVFLSLIVVLYRHKKSLNCESFTILAQKDIK